MSRTSYFPNNTAEKLKITFVSVIKFFFSLGNGNRRIKVSKCFSQIEFLNKGFFLLVYCGFFSQRYSRIIAILLAFPALRQIYRVNPAGLGSNHLTRIKS